MTIDAATDAFRDSTPDRIGTCTRIVALLCASSDVPCASLPTTRATRSGQWTS